MQQFRQAVIWNAHWQELGGGERHAAEIALGLQDSGFSVLILGTGGDPRNEILSRFGINLYSATYAKVGSESEVSEYAQPAHLFVNSSFGSALRAPNANSVFVCFFPAKTSFRFLKKLLPPSNPISLHSLEGFPYLPRRGNRVDCRLPLLVLGQGEIEIQHGMDQDGKALGSSSFRISGDTRHRIFLPGPASGFRRIVSLSGANSSPLTALIRSRNPYYGYQQVWAISQYSSDYFLKYWGIKTRVLYPVADTGKAVSKDRRPKKIISVGRIFPPSRGHSKNFHLLLKAFKRLRRHDSEWSLVIAGGFNPRWEKYLIRLSRQVMKTGEARIMVSPQRDELEQELSSSTFFWSGTGMRAWGHPEKAEHFGIAIVEAISRGLIPFAYDRGGPREILQDFPELRFRGISDLAKKTLRLARDPENLPLLDERVAARFDRSQFQETLRSLLSELESGGEMKSGIPREGTG